MESTESSVARQSTLESPPKRKKPDDDDIQPTKEIFLRRIEDIEDDIKKLKNDTLLRNDTLEERVKELRRQVEVVIQTKDEQIKNLDEEIKSLKKEVESLKAKNESLEKAFVVAQATWVWEAHLARFVVDSEQKIYPIGQYRQMTKYLDELNNFTHDYWTEIQRTLTDWTDEHWEVVDNVRIARNCVAHPYLIDLDLVESEIEATMPPESQVLMTDMLDMLRMTTSLMKFGRLAQVYEWNNHNGVNARALKCIRSWDRKFEEIDGLQNIDHDKAKQYLAKYVSNSRTISHYYFIVDSIKDGNGKRLGKLAWEFEERLPNVGEISTDHLVALEKLKRLLPNPNNEGNVTVLDRTVAKLHIPDFLPKRLWKHGLEILEKYFE